MLMNNRQELHPKLVTFQNTKVGMPIFSLNGMAKQKNRIILDEDFGTIVDKQTSEEYPFVAASGVYFILMRVPRSYLERKSKEREGFGRHGASA